MTPWMRRLHKWIGLLVAIQFLLWMASGLGMSWLEHDRVQGKTWRAPDPEPRAWPEEALPAERVLALSAEPANGIASAWVDGTPVYEVANGTKTRLVSAVTGAELTVDAALARRIAVTSYAGPGEAGEPRRLGPTLETRIHAGDVWRVDFGDDAGTTAYVAADTGRLIVHRNDSWRLFDVLWMLHIMDYTGRADFNNPLVVMSGFAGLWMALSGMWLLFASFHLRDFLPRRFRGGGTLAVHAGNGGDLLRTLPVASGDDAYVALARHGLHLPSNCGGGQSCGLCEVRVRGHAPPATVADRAHIPDARLRMGYRLACNLRVQGDCRIEVAGGANLWRHIGATVERIEAPTPFLREIVLRPDAPVDATFRPGSYIQLHVPAYDLAREALQIPDRHADAWRRIELPAALRNREPVRRAYSLSRPPLSDAGRLHLLVRFFPGTGRRNPPGRGSTWVYALTPGARVEFSGAFGDFALKPGSGEKIFIGGGAGMGPLRAMILARLEAGGRERIHFWYGARDAGDVPYAAEMEALARTHANFSWHPVLSESAPEPDHLLGMVHDAARAGLLESHPAPASCEFYLCGPPAMLSATRQLLARLGVPDDRVAFDDFKI